MIVNLYFSARHWLQPYYLPKNFINQKGQKNSVISEDDNVQVDSGAGVIDYIRLGEKVKPRKNKGLTIVEYSGPIKNVWKQNMFPPPRTLWWFHDSDTHELFGHFMPFSRQDYASKRKKNSRKASMERKTLKPWIRPKGVKYDRTHLIPVGYHGYEASPVLVIGWDQSDNRGVMADFENEVSDITVPFFWYIRVKKQASGVLLQEWVFDARGFKLLKRFESFMDGMFFWE